MIHASSSPLVTVQPCDPSIVELFDETGKSLCSVVEGDGEVQEVSIVFLVPWWALGEAILVVIDLLLEYSNIGLKSFHLLSVDIVSNPDGVSESVNDGSELVWGWVRSGSEDVLDGSGGEGESPGVDGGDRDLYPLLSEVVHLEGVICSEAEMPWEAFSGLFRG